MEKYIVLRRRASRPRNGLETKALGGAPQEYTSADITISDLDPKQAKEASDDPDVTIARSMPTRLICPRASNSDSSDVSWGLEAVSAYRSGLTGVGITVAVLDTGIELSHPVFEGKTILQKDFSNSSDGDRNGHGTHCAGIIFGKEINGKKIGVAPGVRRALVGKILDDTGRGTSEMMFAGLQWALSNRAHVISMSVGLDFPGEVATREQSGWPTELAVSETLDTFRQNHDMFLAIMSLIDRNGSFGTVPLVVAASGNESQRARDPRWRISTSLPASAVHLSVAALGQGGGGFEVAEFSNIKAKISAPGVNIVSAALGGGYVSMSGTSMACPHVAGVAALWAESLKNNGDNINAENLKSHLLANAKRDGITDDIIDVGKGMVQAP